MQYRETLRSLETTDRVAPRDRTGVHPEVAAGNASCAEVLTVGARFGAQQRYELLSCLARGGTSVVHAVHDRWLDRRLAGKFLIGDEANSTATEAEGRALARLRHSNIVMVHDLGVLEGIPYLLLELLEGVTLAELIASKQRLEPRTALRIVIAIALALEHAHSLGVFHFDVKPGNVHVGPNGAVKLVDFGVGSQRLAHIMGANDGAASVVGTPCYMAPEQWNQGTLDARTDIWALGMLLYECLTGKLPASGTLLGLTLASGGRGSHALLSERLGLPSLFDEILARTLTADRSARFEHVGELLMALRLAERVLLEAQISRFSEIEQQLVACSAVCNGPLELAHIASATQARPELVTHALTGLVSQGVLEVCEPAASYQAADVPIAQICLERLSSAKRLNLMQGVSAALSSKPSCAQRTTWSTEDRVGARLGRLTGWRGASRL